MVDDTKLNLVVHMSIIHQDYMERSLNRWKQQNGGVTRECCRNLLIELKKQHLDQALTRLRGPDGCKVTILEIKRNVTLPLRMISRLEPKELGIFVLRCFF